jgi:F420-0:gamma-glutamyl ligase-like protein
MVLLPIKKKYWTVREKLMTIHNNMIKSEDLHDWQEILKIQKGTSITEGRINIWTI